MEPVSTSNVNRIAVLANLDLRPAELRVRAQEFSAILEFVNALKDIKVESVQPTVQVTEVENVFRQDDVIAFAHHRTLLEHSPHRHGDLFRVAAVFNQDER